MAEVFPRSVVDGMIATLVGFGICDVIDRGRQVGGGQFSVKLGPVVMGRQAVVELEVPNESTPLILVFFEERKKIRRVLDFDREDLTREHEAALKPLAPRVVSIRAYEMPMPPDQNDPPYRGVIGLEIPLHKGRPSVLRPLFVAIDERADQVVLAIGNLGDRIEYTPDAPPSYKPPWYDTLAVQR